MTLSRLFLASLVSAAVAATIFALLTAAYPADLAVPCPTANPCKVITLTQEEEQALTGAKGILASAVDARLVDLLGVATYFRDKIRDAPNGTPRPPDKPADPPKPEPPKP